MIKKIGIENFKAFGDYTEFELGKLAVYAGLNSSGKSSIYQALLLLAQSYGSYCDDVFYNRLPILKLNGNLVKLGKNEEILHDPRKRYMRFVLCWDDGVEISYTYQTNLNANEIGSTSDSNNIFFLSNIVLKQDEKVIIGVKSKQNEWTIEACESLRFEEYDITKIIYENIINSLETDEDQLDIEEEDVLSDKALELNDIFLQRVIFDDIYRVDLMYNRLNWFDISLKNIEKSINPLFRDKINWDDLKETFKKNKINTKWSTLVNVVSNKHMAYSLSSESIIAIPPFRGYPQRLYTDATDPNPLSLYITKFNQTISYQYDIENESVIEGSLEEAFNYWLADHFKLADKVFVEEPIPGLATEIYIEQKNKKISIINVGFGTSQILPVIFSLLIQNSKKIIIVDEPEIHLHPSLQSKLADFFFSMALTGRNIFIETHSEYLIDKLIFLSLKHEEKKNLIKLNWIKRKENESKVELIKYDELGYLINPPEGFLNEKKLLVGELNKIRMEKLNGPS